ncbi:MAG: hypothetical protein ACOH1Y_11750 [Propionicimonas sp.]
MIIIRSVLFSRSERQLFAAAQVLIHVAYLPASDPLTPPGQGVPDDDPHLRVLKSLAVNANDPVPYTRLVLAQQTLQELAAAIRAQSSPAYWADQGAGAVMSEQEEGIAVVLTAERTQQAQVVDQAVEVITNAVGSLSEQDDPKWCRDNLDTYDD